MMNEFEPTEQMGAFYDKEGRLYFWPGGRLHWPGGWLDAEKKRRETKMSDYEKSAEVAGKLLKHLEEAGCAVPSVTLFEDGSGHFEIYEEDEATARDIFARYLPEVKLYTHTGLDSDETHFNFSPSDLEKYTSTCETCKRPLETQ